ncbi:hypothetical protein ACW7C8_26945 [Klebsiella pneumoniae]|uniref:hypothetical protein n=1 Tax=Klebsiella pneumoniae TaxID=573 RepID=UPI0004E43CCA|nr:hypothetical protein [Klebsiella pneumoniae]QBQ71680.1 hypothetical protein [Klebsiella phage ST16-OXA48phi5.1]ATM43113.1 hypothetical protein CRN19_12735 [Klebsiella pneumoniae]ATO24818.1 hypothetical protein CR230_19735 [Klebsiella pneumoniae]AWO43701.1 hypothetical protein DLJ66_25345 [Klebsiella pneumoniae]AWO48609.1 hypothetical protein DLJ67_23245 [Klebsiella pneumoniae]
MSDITELAQSLKAAADREMICRDGAETSEIWERTVTPENILALVEALEKAQQRIVDLQQGCENDPSIHEIIDLKERIDNLESFRTAYMEWGEKTDWVQTAKRFDVLKPWGKHRADVLKEYIQHLESRTVTMKLPTTRLWAGVTECYEKSDVIAAIRAAGVEVSDD